MDGLARILADTGNPAIVRATAVAELRAFPSPRAAGLLRDRVADPSALVRRAVAEASAILDPPDRLDLLGALLGDAVRSVRLAVGSALLGVHDGPAESRAARATIVAEYEASRARDVDTAEGLVELARVARWRGEPDQARSLLETAVARDPSFTAAHVNLADLHRARGDDAAGAAVLRAGLTRAADAAAIEHALGLLLVRTGARGEARDRLGRAHALRPEEPGYALAHAAALAEHDLPAAVTLLDSLVARRPGDPRLVSALAAYRGRLGRPR